MLKPTVLAVACGLSLASGVTCFGAAERSGSLECGPAVTGQRGGSDCPSRGVRRPTARPGEEFAQKAPDFTPAPDEAELAKKPFLQSAPQRAEEPSDELPSPYHLSCAEY